MIKRSALFLLLFLPSATAYCQPQTAAGLNKNLSERADSFFHLGAMWGSKLEDINGDSKHYEELKPYRLRAIDYLDLQLKEISAMKDVKNSRDMRMALLDFLKFEKELINTSFMQIERLPLHATDKETQTAFGLLEEDAKKEEPYIMKLMQAQTAYAESNGIKTANEGERR